MQILASSIDVPAGVAKVADTFLHAGYISAYPRTLWVDTYGNQAPEIQLDMVEALRLKAEVVAGATTSSDAPLAAVSSLGSGDWYTWVAAVAAFFGTVALLYFLQDRYAGLRRVWAGAGVAFLAVLAFFAVTCQAELPDEEPWEEITLKEYENPELATKAILYGIIADGVHNIGQPVSSLANIQDEVGLPVAKPTEGQAYALQTYGIDGWGNDFRLTKEGGLYDVRSAGADGKFDTDDDLGIKIDQCDNESWDQHRWAFFVAKDGDSVMVLYHRWNGDHFKYNNRDKAEAATGDELFDLFTADDLAAENHDGDQLAFARAAFDAVAGQVDHAPLVLQAYPGATALP